MRYADMVIKALSLIALAVLFMLFLRYAAGFGENENVADLAKCNILIVIMILILLTSAVSSLAFDFYERNKQQNEQIFSDLNIKISKLSELEEKINNITAQHGEKMEALHNDLAQKVAENTAKVEEYMTQFANLSVQVFSKDKQAQNMRHESPVSAKPEFSGDYFNHYTEKTPQDTIEDEPIELTPADKIEFSDEPIELTPADKVEFSLPETKQNDGLNADSESFEIEKVAGLSQESLPTNLIDDILNDENKKSDISEKEAENNLASIFNDELADTLAELEIMKDDNKPEAEEIDLSAYFSDDEKVKL